MNVQKWEYLLIEITVGSDGTLSVAPEAAIDLISDQPDLYDFTNVNTLLNSLGSEGWEMFDKRYNVYTFKRPLSKV